MDVILLQDIERVGREGAVVKVKPGFARNYLLPHGLAVTASPEQLRLVEARQQHRRAIKGPRGQESRCRLFQPGHEPDASPARPR